jgi:carboxyl-terminal processing protease
MAVDRQLPVFCEKPLAFELGETVELVDKIERAGAIVQARSVKSAQIDPAYFYLKISHFHKHTAEKMLAELSAAYQQANALKGIVLDLRDNPGGVLKAAVAVSAAFLPEDALVVYTESESEQSRMRLVAKPVYGADGEDYSKALRAALKSVPLVVLVNGSSASASEIVAAALQDNGRAIVVGTTSFGKGSVQTVVPLPNDGELFLTWARFHAPSVSIELRTILNLGASGLCRCSCSISHFCTRTITA